MAVLLRSIRPSVYNIRQQCGCERYNVYRDGLMGFTLQRTRCPPQPETVRAFLFGAHLLPSAISTNVSCFHTGFQYLVHMIIVICLTHLFSFLTMVGRYLVVTLAEPRSRQLPTVSHFSHSICGLMVCEPLKARRRRSNLIIRQLSALHGGDLSWAVPGLASSFMSCVLHLVMCPTFFTYATAGRTEHVLIQVVCAPHRSNALADFFFHHARGIPLLLVACSLLLVAGAITTSSLNSYISGIGRVSSSSSHVHPSVIPCGIPPSNLSVVEPRFLTTTGTIGTRHVLVCTTVVSVLQLYYATPRSRKLPPHS